MALAEVEANPAGARRAVKASESACSVAPLPTLQVGSSGPAVEQLQLALAARGYSIDTDGIYGPATRSVVAAYQGSIGLTDDGIAGAVTLAALGMGQARTGDYASLDALLAEVLDGLRKPRRRASG